MLWAVAIWGAAFAGFAVARTLWLTLAMLAIAGAADTFTVVFRGTIVQQTTPDEFRGRVTAADYVVGVSGGQLGSLEAGALGSLTSPAISALSGGLATIAGAIVIGLVLPAFARYQAQPRTQPQQSAQPSGRRVTGGRRSSHPAPVSGRRTGTRQRREPSNRPGGLLR
jgi:MFS family permease